jgi:hypothetical protein
MTTKTELPTRPKEVHLPTASPIAVVTPLTVEPMRSARPYWGDRLTIGFWIACFVLLGLLNLFEAVGRLLFHVVGSW